MKHIIVPDIHEQYEKLVKLEPYLEKADRVTFLGDWFDSFRPGQHMDTAHWLKEHIDVPGWEYLLGNHDCHYAFRNAGFICSGYRQMVKEELSKVLTEVEWGKFKVFALTDDKEFLLSHAGLRPETEHFLKLEDEALAAAYTGGFHDFWRAGFYRGGDAKFGGPTWLDFNREMNPLRTQRQIVGHTSGSAKVRWHDGHGGRTYCIDTGLRHVAYYENGTLEFRQLEDMK